ncbi:MAG TPA: hypothetical protein VHB79_10390 [Polyangiaceae bacterium]|nr:hypothetical protein [Polyangiaceae bacterium]
MNTSQITIYVGSLSKDPNTGAVTVQAEPRDADGVTYPAFDVALVRDPSNNDIVPTTFVVENPSALPVTIDQVRHRVREFVRNKLAEVEVLLPPIRFNAQPLFPEDLAREVARIGDAAGADGRIHRVVAYERRPKVSDEIVSGRIAKLGSQYLEFVLRVSPSERGWLYTGPLWSIDFRDYSRKQLEDALRAAAGATKLEVTHHEGDAVVVRAFFRRD